MGGSSIPLKIQLEKIKEQEIIDNYLKDADFFIDGLLYCKFLLNSCKAHFFGKIETSILLTYK